MENKNIQIMSIKLLTKCLRFVNMAAKEEILIFLGKYLYAKNFYERRLYMFFFNEALELFSIAYLKSNIILDNIFRFFTDHAINQCNLINSLKNIYFLIDDDIEYKTMILNKLTEIRNSKSVADLEVFRAINNFDKWWKVYQNNKFDYYCLKAKDAHKQDEEKALLLKEKEKLKAKTNKTRSRYSVELEEKLRNKSGAASFVKLSIS